MLNGAGTPNGRFFNQYIPATSIIAKATSPINTAPINPRSLLGYLCVAYVVVVYASHKLAGHNIVFELGRW